MAHGASVPQTIQPLPCEFANPSPVQVIEYLSKKGYTRTEAMLRVESASQNTDSNPNGNGVVTPQDVKYEKALRKTLFLELER